MAKITVPLLPQATPEYNQSQMAQLIQTLDQLIFALNNTYTSEPLRNDNEAVAWFCLLYTSPSPRDGLLSRMPSSA